MTTLTPPIRTSSRPRHFAVWRSVAIVLLSATFCPGSDEAPVIVRPAHGGFCFGGETARAVLQLPMNDGARDRPAQLSYRLMVGRREVAAGAKQLTWPVDQNVTQTGVSFPIPAVKQPLAVRLDWATVRDADAKQATGKVPLWLVPRPETNPDTGAGHLIIVDDGESELGQHWQQRLPGARVVTSQQARSAMMMSRPACVWLLVQGKVPSRLGGYLKRGGTVVYVHPSHPDIEPFGLKPATLPDGAAWARDEDHVFDARIACPIWLGWAAGRSGWELEPSDCGVVAFQPAPAEDPPLASPESGDEQAGAPEAPVIAQLIIVPRGAGRLLALAASPAEPTADPRLSWLIDAVTHALAEAGELPTLRKEP